MFNVFFGLICFVIGLICGIFCHDLVLTNGIYTAEELDDLKGNFTVFYDNVKSEFVDTEGYNIQKDKQE